MLLKGKRVKIIAIALVIFVFFGLLVVIFCVFFDEAVLVRKGTVYRVPAAEKLVALTFDDGPSPVWTPKILDKLDEVNVKATFFMLGEHVRKYPEIARMVAERGHEIENHTFTHHVIFYYTMEELEKELSDTDKAIKDVTGRTTKYFRPPKAWLTADEKNKIGALGYKIVLWSLNSKDWVTFDDKYIIHYIINRVQPGDIILFHDSGGVFGAEGGDRSETVLAVKRLVERLREKGFQFVTIDELIKKYGE